MVDSKRSRLATLTTCVALAFGGFGAAGCGDDDGEGVAEEAGQELDEAGEDAGDALEQGGDEVEDATDQGGDDSQ